MRHRNRKDVELMDQTTLKNLHTEVNESVKWLRGEVPESDRSMPADFFGVGVVAARHSLSRDQVDELLKHMQSELNRAVQRRETDEFWADIKARAICPN